MTAGVNHKIRRVTIDFQFNGKTDGFSFQQEVRDWFDEFVAKLEEEFTNLSATDQVVQIELIELEVSLDGRDWRALASEKIIRQLNDRIRLMRTGEISASGLKETTAAQQFEEYFLHYLEYGYLPWPSSGLSITQWNEELKLLALSLRHGFRSELVRTLLRSNNALQRFIQLVPTESALQLIRTAASGRSPYQEEFMHDLTLLIKRNVFAHDPALKRFLYRGLMASYLNDQEIFKIEGEVVAVLRENFSGNVKLKERFTKIPFRSASFIAVKAVTAKAKDLSDKKGEATGLNRKTDTVKERWLLDNVPTAELTSDESIFIANAGLVIVAPFLPGLLERLKLAYSGILLDEAKAIGITHFLATGNDHMQEYETVLAKILCGIPVQKPVNVNNLRVTKKMRSEVENVLSSVIEHWSIPGNTSASGLRESFLKRNGKLRFDGHDWLLQVEQQPYDMLLQHLPWTISMIKLPWMQHMLKTDWVY